MIPEQKLAELRDKYPNGTRIKLLKTMDDKQPIKSGEIGKVDFIDDTGSIHMLWNNGSTLALIEDVDYFEIISKPEKIKVIIAEPKKEPYVKEIYNTLAAKQELVGGYIQAVPSFFDDKDSYDFIVNEEGKLEGLPLNRYIYDKKDIVAGTLVLAKVDNEKGDYITIPDYEIDFLLDKLETECPMYRNIFELNKEEMEEIER